MILVSVLAVPFASIVRTTDVRTGGREDSAIEDREPLAVLLRGDDLRAGGFAMELLRTGKVDGTGLLGTILGLGFSSAPTVLLRWRPAVLTGDGGRELMEKAGASDGFSIDDAAEWRGLTGDEQSRLGSRLEFTATFLAVEGVG